MKNVPEVALTSLRPDYHVHPYEVFSLRFPSSGTCTLQLAQYRCTDEAPDNPEFLVVKAFPFAAKESYERERDALRKLSYHSGVVQCDYEGSMALPKPDPANPLQTHGDELTCGTFWYTVTHFVQGGTLREYYNRVKNLPLTEQEIRAVAFALARALSEVHSAGVLYGNLKMENVIINRSRLTNEDELELVLCGFSRAKIVGDDLSPLLEDVKDFGKLLAEFCARDTKTRLAVPWMEALISRCLSDASKRPTMAEVLQDPFLTGTETLASAACFTVVDSLDPYRMDPGDVVCYKGESRFAVRTMKDADTDPKTARFIEEAGRTLEIQQEHAGCKCLAKIENLMQVGKDLYVIMEHCGEEALTKCSEPDVRTVARALASAFLELKEASKVPCCITEENVWVTRDEKGDCAVKFSWLHSIDKQLLEKPYIAPELNLAGKPDDSYWVWNFGILLKSLARPSTGSLALSDLAEKCLADSPSERLRMEDLLRHPYFTAVDPIAPMDGEEEKGVRYEFHKAIYMVGEGTEAEYEVGYCEVHSGGKTRKLFCKRYSSRPKATECAENEIKILNKLKAVAGVIGFQSHKTIENRKVLFFETPRYASVMDLLAACNKRGRTIRLIGTEVAKTLKAIFSANIVHRNITPSNVLVVHTPEASSWMRVTGLEEAVELPNTSGRLNCVHNYTAPELVAGRSYTCRSDLWSFGVFLYHLLDKSAMHRWATDGKIRLPEAEKGSNVHIICNVIRKCLVESPEERMDIDAIISKLAIRHKS